MSKLDHLYEGKENLERAGYEIPENILHDLDKLETELIKDEVLPAISKDIEPRLSKIRRDVVLVVEYHPGEPLSVAMTRKVKISEISGAITLTPKRGTPVTSDEKPEETPEHEPTASHVPRWYSNMPKNSHRYYDCRPTKSWIGTHPSGWNHTQWI